MEFIKLKSQRQTFLLIFHVMVLHITSTASSAASYSEDNICPRHCRCSPGSSTRSNITCNVTSHIDWELTCGHIMVSPHAYLKVLGNVTSMSGRLSCSAELHSLDLSETFLVPTDGTFHSLNVDSLLNISSNKIKTLPANVFSSLMQLYELDISHNSISTLEPDVFKGLNSLRILHLGFNNLSILSLGLFAYLPHLEYLGLENNRIMEFSIFYISHSASLRSLNLRGNLLQTIITDVDAADLYLWQNVSSLDISENQLECSCSLRNLYKMLPDFNKTLVNPSATTCSSPEKYQGQSILDVNKSELVCTAPNGILSFPSNSKEVLTTTSITLQCRAKGYPKPSVMWITPWNDRFFSGSQTFLQSQGLQLPRDIRLLTHRQYKEPNVFMVSSIYLTNDDDLVINKIRGSMSGNYTCVTFNFAGNASLDVNLLVYSAIKTSILHSLFVGGYCASGFLIFGFVVGLVKMLVVWLRHKLYFIAPTFSKAASTQQPGDHSTCQSLDVSVNKPDSDDSTPDSSLLAHGDEQEKLSSEEKSDDSFDSHNFGGWLHHGIFDSFEEARGKFRYGVERKMERMRKNVQSIKDSSSSYVQSIVDSSNTAASRMKAGMVFGVEAVKYHVQSFKELCGTGDMGLQTISTVSVETDVDTNQQKEVIKQITFV